MSYTLPFLNHLSEAEQNPEISSKQLIQDLLVYEDWTLYLSFQFSCQLFGLSFRMKAKHDIEHMFSVQELYFVSRIFLEFMYPINS